MHTCLSFPEMETKKKRTEKSLYKPSTLAAAADDVLAPAAGLRRIRRAPVARTTVSLLGT